MKFVNAMQFKAIINKKAREYGISSQLLLQSYMLERLLFRLSISKYKNNFIIKGGFLISSVVGLVSRSTMDLDTTLKGINITDETVKDIFDNVCSLSIDDDISFEISSIKSIREKDDYPGIRVSLLAKYSSIIVPISVDLTIGDIITPAPIITAFPKIFDNDFIYMTTYNLETILAEKIETILSRNVVNTRPRDYYDVFILYKLFGMKLDFKILKQALINTSKKRKSEHILLKYESILFSISKSHNLLNFWNRYRKSYDYAATIDFDDLCFELSEVIKLTINSEEN